MAVAMASCGIISGIHTNLKAIEKLPISSPGLFRGSFGLEPIQRICMVPKRLAFSESTIVPKASSAAAVEDGSSQETAVPTPKVIIDLDSNPDATVVEVTFGDRLGALVDTMSALKNLGLNVVKANVCLDSSGKHTTLCITNASTGRKVDDPEQLEAIRLTIINNMIEFHPESSALLAMGEVFGAYQPNQKESLGVTGKIAVMSPGGYRFEPWKQTLAEMQGRAVYNRPLWSGPSPDLAHSGSLLDVDIATHIHVYDDGPDRSLLYVEAADRPGLIVDLVKIITEINIDVESGEFDTEGLLAKAKFHVSYKNKALIKPLQQVLANSLRYYLRRPTTEESSF